MEDYRNKVANLLANQSQNTSKFAGETNQIRLGGPWGGLPLLLEPLAAVCSPPQNRGCPWGLGPGHMLLPLEAAAATALLGQPQLVCLMRL